MGSGLLSVLQMLKAECSLPEESFLPRTGKRASSLCPVRRAMIRYTCNFHRAVNLSLIVNLGKVSSSLLGALPPGRLSNLGLSGSNRAGNWGIREDEVTPEELFEALVLHVLQEDFQTRL